MIRRITRRDFIKLIGGGALLMSGCSGDVTDRIDNIVDEIGTGLDVKAIRQIITRDISTSRCVMWQTDSPLLDPTLEIRSSGSDEIRSIVASDCSFTDDDKQIYQYVARIDDLNANHRYEYRAVDGDDKSSWHDLRTSDGRSFKALIFPDSQCADYSVWSNVAAAAYEQNPDADFFVNVGDIVDNGEDWTQWRAWFNGAAFIDHVPFVPVMGNHETYSRQWTIRLPIAYLNYFDVPPNDSADFARYYYSFDYGDVHFIVLNTEWIETDEFIGGLRDEQLDWLRRDMSSSAARWQIVFMHRDVLQYRINDRPDRAEGFSEIGTTFMPLFDELGVDIVFTAHLHTYRDRGHIFNFDHDPRGALYILTGIAGDVRYPGLWIDHALDEVIAPQPETDNYLTLEVNVDEMIVRCFLIDGTEIDRVVVNK